jgi:hypothetical protein
MLQCSTPNIFVTNVKDFLSLSLSLSLSLECVCVNIYQFAV